MVFWLTFCKKHSLKQTKLVQSDKHILATLRLKLGLLVIKSQQNIIYSQHNTWTWVSLNSPTCIKTLVGVRVPVPISEQAEKPKTSWG